MRVQRDRRTPGQVLGLERLPHLRRRDLAAVGVGARLDDLAELDLQPARQVQVVLGPHDVGDAALAGLAVDPDHGLVGAADVLRVDRQVRHRPAELVDRYAGRRGVALHPVEALLDGVLVRAGEGRVDQVAAVRVPLVHRQLVAVLDGAADLVDVAEVDLRVDALREQVQAERHQADVAGALAVAEQAALDPVGTGQVAQLGGGDRRAAVVVRVQRQDHRVAVREVAVHPLDRVGVDVRRRHLDGRRQVDDRLAVRRRLPHVVDRVADLDGELELGAGVGLRRVLERTTLGVASRVSASLRHSRAPCTAMSVMPSCRRPKTTRRCSVDVELYRCTIACLAPRIDSKVRSISASRAWVSTWMTTSSGIRSSSMSWRTKSKSVWLADGKPTSISL